MTLRFSEKCLILLTMNVDNIFLLIKENFLLSVTVFFTVIVLLFVLGIVIGRLVQKLKDMRLIQQEREDAVKRSRAVLGGQFGEQLAPYLPNFPCNPGDVRFLGKPIDYVAFPGSAEGKEIKEILLIEVKSGESSLTAREKEIKAAVEKGQVRYVTYRIP